MWVSALWRIQKKKESSRCISGRTLGKWRWRWRMHGTDIGIVCLRQPSTWMNGRQVLSCETLWWADKVKEMPGASNGEGIRWKRQRQTIIWQRIVPKRCEDDGIVDADVVCWEMEKVKNSEIMCVIVFIKLWRAAGISDVTVTVESATASGKVGIEMITEIV